MHFVLSEGRGVDERLTDVFLFEVGQLLDNLRGRHAVGHQVHHVSYRDAKATDRRPPSQDVGTLRDAIERLHHDLPMMRSYRTMPLAPRQGQAAGTILDAFIQQVTQRRLEPPMAT